MISQKIHDHAWKAALMGRYLEKIQGLFSPPPPPPSGGTTKLSESNRFLKMVGPQQGETLLYEGVLGLFWYLTTTGSINI